LRAWREPAGDLVKMDIADASYRPVPIRCLSDIAGAQPLDLSHDPDPVAAGRR